jgi:hypothetical protein
VIALSVSRRSLGVAEHEFPARRHLLRALAANAVVVGCPHIQALEPLSA